MQLRDSLEIWVTGDEYKDEMGDWVPGPPEFVATCPAQVYYSTADMTLSNDYGRFVLTENLRAVIEDPGFKIEADHHWIVWRGEKYRVDGVLVRSARGATHHLTLELTWRR
ncbi:MAG: hypothetical protein ACK5LO_00930 [Leucobacter sp.]